ncbi:hypothetical protein ElyMa_002299900 [Elysia marginata]|uniref:Uncharacterized protein n=1 Tax=Elysia marginata TaxID=1093978 RepID=A0AAV4G5G7_9GAST|nr:hypothetical protein ElyMa_002299900 [Elysia marginata]
MDVRTCEAPHQGASHTRAQATPCRIVLCRDKGQEQGYINLFRLPSFILHISLKGTKEKILRSSNSKAQREWMSVHVKHLTRAQATPCRIVLCRDKGPNVRYLLGQKLHGPGIFVLQDG